MGSIKLKILNISLLVALGLSSNATANEYEEYLKQQQAGYNQYKASIEEQFNAYTAAYDEAFKEFAKSLGEKWPDVEPDVTTKTKWVEYGKDLNTKKSIDYEKEQMSFEVIAANEEEAKKKIEELFNATMKKDVEQAKKDDILEKKVQEKIKKSKINLDDKVVKAPKKSNKKLIADIINAQEQQRLKEKVKTQKLVKVKHNGKFIYKANVKLPSDTTQRKAKAFKSAVHKNATKQKIPAELVYAIMHSESSFNPMARSHIPAFGLMQIVPKTAGVDAYYFLYKKKKVLSSDYLYDSSKNVETGSAYLHILYYRYLRKITDLQSRLYCAIAAYNTGAGNVAKAFIGSTNINKAAVKINSMKSQEVYNHLLKNLPYNETKHYLKKVNDRVSAYNKLLKTTL